MRSQVHRSPASAAFTLVELLIAMSVLALLVVLMSQLLSNTLTVTSIGNKRMDADSQARLVMDRLSADIARMVRRRDVDYYFQKNTGNDQMAFFSEMPAYHPDALTSEVPKSSIALVGYRVERDELERLSKGLVWNGVTSSTPGATGLAPTDLPMVFGLGAAPGQKLVDSYKTQGGSSSITTTGAGSDPDYQPVGSDVYRFEYCFLMKDGTLSGVPYKAPNTAVNGLEDVRAIVVAIAVLDSASRATLTESDITSAAAKLPDVAGTTLTAPPMTLWQSQIDSGDLGLPERAASQVRFYQRHLHLDAPP